MISEKMDIMKAKDNKLYPELGEVMESRIRKADKMVKRMGKK